MGHEIASAKAMTEAAEAFLPALSPELRASAAFDFDSTERHTWHYIPKVRGGVMRGRMDPAQLEAADRLMASGLSRTGFDKAKAIIAHESILDRIEEVKGGTRFDRSPGRYYHALFGDPSGGRALGLARRGTPPVPQLHHRRRRHRRVHAILLRREPRRGQERAREGPADIERRGGHRERTAAQPRRPAVRRGQHLPGDSLRHHFAVQPTGRDRPAGRVARRSYDGATSARF